MKIYEWLDALADRAAAAVSKPFIDFKNDFSARIREGLTEWLLNMNPTGTDLLRESLAPLIDNPDCPEALKPILREWTSHTPPLIAGLAPLVGALVAYPAVHAAFTPMLQELTQEVNARIQPQILSPAEIINARRRGFIDDKFAAQEWLWGGFDKQRSEVLTGLTLFYPSPSDFIRFAVRDTFNESVVKRYGYDDGYPEQIDAYALKAGMPREWLKHYWRAHWELPSPTQMYEMLHRNKISMADAENLLRIADYAPYFIKPMLDISYNPFTRVDVRRMWDSGVLTREQVKAAYMDGGYNEERAEMLTKWTVSDGMKEELDLTKAEIKAAYQAGSISKSDATASIIQLGYDDKEADIIISLVDYATEKALKTREKNIAVKTYVKGRSTKAEFIATLDALKLSEREKGIVIKEAELQIKETEE